MQKVGAFFCVFFTLSGLVYSQTQYGNLRGVVIDTGGMPLPGVTITLTSEEYGNRTVITTEGGAFRFINISPGICKIQCELSGFKTYIQENLDIRIGTNYDLDIVLEITTLQEEVTIVAESPIVDTKKVGTAVNVTLTQLQEVPSARDPWVILQQAPGIFVNRENVGGSHSGSQAGFTSKGAWGAANMYNMDGVAITDMAATGSSSRYFDFDSFEEMQIITTGADASIQSAGVSVNFVTRRGGNKFEVMGRAFFTNDKLQGDNRTQELKDLEYVGNRIEQIADYGLQLGGPIIRDRIWFWIGYGVQDIERLTIDGYPDSTKLQGINSKLNFQISRNNRAELAFLLNYKQAFNRGAGPRRPPETTWDQKGNGAPFMKFEDEHTFSDNFLLSLKLGGKIFGDWWEVSPNGGIDAQAGYDLGTGVLTDTNSYYRSERPDLSGSLSGNYFLEDLLGGDHEFKFGVEYRYFPTKSRSTWPQDAYKYYINGEPAYGEVVREGRWNYLGTRLSIYLNDSFSWKRLTLNLGLRFDHEKSIVKENSVPASTTAPDLLPAITFPKIDPHAPLNTLAPRLGLTYALTADRKTILRTNLARYSVQQPAGLALHMNPSNLSWAGYVWKDLNGDDWLTTDELVGYPDQILWFVGFDPNNPASTESPNAIDQNLKAIVTDEFILGVEREILTDFSLAANVTLRRTHRLQKNYFYNEETGWVESKADWLGPIQKSLTYDGALYDYEYWTLNRYKPAGTIKRNRPDYHMNITVFELIATKRLSNKWMMNGSFTVQRHVEHFGENGYTDPTNIDKWDGQQRLYDSRWMAKLTFLYQLPWGFTFSGFAHAREGTVFWKALNARTPERAAVGLGSWMNLDTELYGTTRQPNFYNCDLSLVKDFVMGRYGRLTFQVDAFNIFNFNHTLQRYYQVNSSRAGEIENILNPRVIRFGVRYRF